VAVTDLINWADVLGWTGHKQLLEKHGLVDGLTMASALHEAERQAWLLLEREGYQALGEWLLRQDEAKVVLRVPTEVALPLWEASEHQLDDEKPTVFCSDFFAIGERLLDLEYLDRQKGLSPRLWVRPEHVNLSARAKASAAGGFPCLSFMYSLLYADESSVPNPGKVYIIGMELGINPWWQEETLAAARHLARLSKRRLAEEVKRAVLFVAGGNDTQEFWEVVGRPRQMHVRELASADPWEERDAVRAVDMPEFGAIPFYHKDQLPELHAAVVQGHVKLSLLGRLADSDFKTGKVSTLRNRFGYPRVETRGRGKRDPAMIAEARRLVEEEGLSKYAAAKRLKMKRPTVYDYLRAGEEARPGSKDD
jgi:hypothetical protein